MEVLRPQEVGLQPDVAANLQALLQGRGQLS